MCIVYSQDVCCKMKIEIRIISLLLLYTANATQPSKAQECDLGANDDLREGNIGESGSFKWLGILRLHIHERDSFKVALTGLVLVKDKYAIAHAGDIMSIPRHKFLDDSRAMFIAANNNPWFCKPKSYMAHPEYEYSTLVTVALIELDITDEVISPLKPICWPEYSFNTSNQLYALGYVDENQLLEKVIHKVQYVSRSLCDEFYNRSAGKKSSRLNVPVYYECAYAVNNTKNCVWDNGMVLASNSTGRWTLIGFGVKGPGCAGPTRFIDMTHYLPWIDSATSNEQVPDYEYR